MPDLVDVVDSGQGALAGYAVLGHLSGTWTLGSPDALAGASVRIAWQDAPARPARRISIRARRRELPERLVQALERASELLQLRKGWNSYDAEPVSDAAFERTIEFLTTYLVEGVVGPVLVPTVRGGVQLEWHRGGVDIEVDVGPDGSVSWCVDDRRTGEDFEAPLAGHEETIRTWLRRASD